MPGTVQVSILELQGLPTSTPSSSMSIKVSLGKNAYETQGEKGDFLLPLATFRDNLVVKVHDADGNEIACTGVKSRSIAEKGLWDDVFPLEGGGHVHMRLKFSLSEEERNKIRGMRESALKKKQYELLIRSSEDLGTGVTSSGGKKENPATAAISNKVRSSDLPKEASSKVMSPKSGSKAALSSAPKDAREDTQHYNPMDQTQLVKAPSKVRKRVAALEGSPLLQEQISDVNLTTAKLQSSRKIADVHSKKQTLGEISAENVESPIDHIKRVEDPALDGSRKHQTSARDERLSIEIHNTSHDPKSVEYIELIAVSKGNSHENVSSKEVKDQMHDLEVSWKRVSSKESCCSSSLEQYTMSGRVLLHSDKSQPSNPVIKQQFASVDSFPSEARRGHSKRSQERMRPEVSGRKHDGSCQNFRGWIFLEETTRSCVADNRTVIDLLADIKINKKNYTGKFFNDNVTSSSGKKHSGITKKPKSSPSSGSGDSRGPNGRVLKIAIMVGFGLLVLFTRKTKSR